MHHLDRLLGFARDEEIDKMPSHASLGILDLPPFVLARIAAAVSRAPLEPYANLDFCVNCNSEQLLAVIPMLYTCRAFRKAVLEAVGGVDSITISNELSWRPCSVSSPQYLVPATVVSVDMLVNMPNLVSLKDLKLIDANTDVNIDADIDVNEAHWKRLLSGIRILRKFHQTDRSWFSLLVPEDARVLAQAHAASLKEVAVACYDPQAERIIFGSLSSEVEKVQLDVIKGYAPVLSQAALSNVRRVVIKNDPRTNSSALFQQLATAPRLTDVVVSTDGYACADIVKLVDAPELIHIDLLGNFTMGVEEALVSNTFHKIQTLKCILRKFSNDQSQELCALITAMRASLRSLKLGLCPGVDTLIQLCMIPLHPDCEVDLTIQQSQFHPYDLLQPLMNYDNLVSLTLKGRGRDGHQSMYLVDKLHLFQNLRNISFADFLLTQREANQFRSNAPPHLNIETGIARNGIGIVNEYAEP